MITLKNIVDAIRDISIQDRGTYPEHLQIKTFGFGPITDFDQEEINGCILWLIPTTHPINGNLITYTFDLNIFDLVDENNNLDVVNDTLLIFHDIIKRLNSKNFKKNYGFSIDSEATPETVMYAFSQNVSGNHGEIKFTVSSPMCDTAFSQDSITIPTNPI